MHPKINTAICEAIQKHPDISEKSLSDQWNDLILLPLSRLDRITDGLQPVLVLIVDALDECENEKDIELLLKLFSQVKEIRATRLQVFITSRPETPIRNEFNYFPEIRGTHQDIILHHIPKPIVSGAISLFL
jgi:hypothetical protein